MTHPWHCEEPIPIVDIEVGVRKSPMVDGLVVIDRVSWADQLVRPSDVLNQLSVMLRARKVCDIRADCLDTGDFSMFAQKGR